MADDALDFGLDLGAVRDRLGLMGYFLGLSDICDASEALDGSLPSVPPAAFVGTASERADPNTTIGGFSQRVRVGLNVLFVESTMSAAADTKDRIDETKRAVIRQLIGWIAPGTQTPLSYAAFNVISIGEGLVWCEVQFTTSYRLST